MKLNALPNAVCGESVPAVLTTFLVHGRKDIWIAQTFSEINKYAEPFKDLLTSAISGTTNPAQLLQDTAALGISLNKLAAILFTVGHRNQNEICKILGITSIRLVEGLIRKGVCEFANEAGVPQSNSPLIKLAPIKNAEKIAQCLRFVEEIQSWVKNPTIKQLPKTEICLPADQLAENIPWLEGRRYQFEKSLRTMIEENNITGTRTLNNLFAWVEVERSGRIILTVSALNKEQTESPESKLTFNPKLGRFLIGAATNRDGIQKHVVSEFTYAKLLKGKDTALKSLQRLYPAIPTRGTLEETILLLADGVIDLQRFEAERTLKVTVTELKNKTENNGVSKTAVLQLIGSFTLPTDKLANNGDTHAPAHKFNRVSVSLPSRFTLDRGMETCSIHIDKTCIHELAKSGRFLGTSFKVVAHKQGAQKETCTIGRLFFSERQTQSGPVFKFHSGQIDKRPVEAHAWGEQALNWISSPNFAIPTGWLGLAAIHSANRIYASIAGADFNLYGFPKDTSRIYALPCEVSIDKAKKKLMLIFNSRGEFEGAVSQRTDGVEQNRVRLVAATKYKYFPPAHELHSNWNVIENFAKQVASEHNEMFHRLKTAEAATATT